MNTVLAERHNNLYERIISILGNGSGRNGYGQGYGQGYGPSPESFSVSKLLNANNNLITAETLNAMYSDLVRCRIHQTGISPTEIAEIIANQNIIAEETSFFITQQNGNVIEVQDVDGTKKGILDFERLIEIVESNKFVVHPSQVTLEPAITSRRTRPWNGLIFHEVSATFRDANHRRHFFNSGGEIRMSLSNSGAVTPKGQDWGLLCANLGVVSFKAITTEAPSIAITNNIGNYGLTTTYQTLINYVGGGNLTGIYLGLYNTNLVTIKARAPSSNIINFRIEFNDLAEQGTPFDDNVDGRLESVLQQYRAIGDYVQVPSPVYSNIVSIS